MSNESLNQSWKLMLSDKEFSHIENGNKHFQYVIYLNNLKGFFKLRLSDKLIVTEKVKDASSFIKIEDANFALSKYDLKMHQWIICKYYTSKVEIL
jgi:hypothetical protein